MTRKLDLAIVLHYNNNNEVRDFYMHGLRIIDFILLIYISLQAKSCINKTVK